MLTIVGLASVGCAVEGLLTTAMFMVGAQAGGEGWLHNDTQAALRRINAGIFESLARTASALAHEPDIVAAIAANDARATGAALDNDLQRDDPDDRFQVRVGGAELVGNVACPQISSVHDAALVSCAGAPYFAVHASPDDGNSEIWLLRKLGPRYVDSIADITLAEVELVSSSGIVSSIRSMDGDRLSLPVSETSDEAVRNMTVHLPRPYRGVRAWSVDPEDWPGRGKQSFDMLVDTRPLGDQSEATVAVMLPVAILFSGIRSAIVALLAVGVLMIALIAFVADRLIRRYARPLQQLEHAAHEIAAGDLQARLSLDGADDDVVSLAHSFNTMVDQLVASRTQLLQTEKLAGIGQLAAGIAHEINTPVQYVGDNSAFAEKGFQRVLHAALALRALLPSDARAQQLSRDSKLDYYEREVPKAFASASDGLRRVATIVQAMRDFSHPSKGQKVLVSLHDLIEAAATISKNEWKYVADLDVNVDATLPAVPALSDELSQAFLNMIVNAAHAISARFPDGAQRGHIAIAARRRGDCAVITIGDDGAGMSAQVQKRIFEPFFTTKPIGQGTGQGLAITYAVVVDKHDGTIDVSSIQNEGTTFTITLPLADADAHESEPATSLGSQAPLHSM
ncbi:MAG TPA: HAMP domain-containing sensor histidine kinase [Myxococcota bacterium]